MNICPNCPEGILDPECSPLWSWLQFREPSFSSSLSFHTVISSLAPFILSLSPLRPYLPPAPFYFLSALHSRRSPSPSYFISLNIELTFSFVYICSDREKLPVLECDLGGSGVHLGPLEDLHSSLITLIRNTVPFSALWESPTLRHFGFSLAVQPSLGILSQGGLHISGPFLSSDTGSLV